MNRFPTPGFRERVAGRLVYMAGPYAHPTEEGRLQNVERICRLSRAVLRCGGIPVVVHPTILHGGYGEPSDTDPAERARGMTATLAIARFIRDAGGLCVALTRDDNSLSDGTRDEVRLFESMNVYPVYPSEVL